MANFYAYLVLIMGMSLLFAFAGVQTTMGSLLGTFVTITPSSPTTNMSVDTNQFQWNGHSGSPWLIAAFAIVGAFVLVGGIRAALGGIFGIAETIKATVALSLLGLMVGDMIGLLSYINGLNMFGGVIKVVAFLVYLPLAAGMIISAIDWIGGGR